MCTLYGTHQTAFGASVRSDVCDFYQDVVAMHGGANRMRRHKNVARQPSFQVRRGRCKLRNHESKTVAMQAEFSRNQVLARRSLWNRIPIRVHRNQLSYAPQLLQALIEFTPLVSMEPKFTQELLVAGSLLRLALNLFQDGGVREH